MKFMMLNFRKITVVILILSCDKITTVAILSRYTG